MNSSNQYNNDLGKYFDKFMFNSFVLPDKICQEVNADITERPLKIEKSKRQIKIAPKTEKIIRFPVPLSEIERKTSFVNTNLQFNKPLVKIENRCTVSICP